jgi:hypothetical protein
MADTKISALTDGNPAQSDDQIPVNRGGVNRRITAGSIAALASGLPLQLPIIADRYYYGLGSETGAGSEAADTWDGLVVAVPFIAGSSDTLTRIGINVAAAQAGVTAWLGIYSSGADGLPDSPIDSTEVSLAATGNVEGTISAAVTQGQRYWMACAVEADGTAELQVDTIIPAISFLVYGTDENMGTVSCVTASHIFGDLPDPFGTVTYETSDSPPFMWVRKV